MKSRQSAAFFVSLLALSLPLTFPSPLLADEPLAPWQSVDIGDVGLAGSAEITDFGNDMLVTGAGSDIWGSADSFHFVYQTFHDGVINANPPAQTATNPFAKAGVMIRMSLDPGSPHVILDIKPDGTFEFMTRQTQDGDTTFISGGPFSGRLQLVRRKGVVTAQECNVVCRPLGTASFPTGAALAGVAVTSHDPSTLNRVDIVNPPAMQPDSVLWWSLDVGSVGVPGEMFLDDDTYTVRGAGADMWGTEDSYHAARRYFVGDGFIIARVTGEDATNTFAKAGVEIDNGNKVLLDVRPNGLIEFMARASGGSMQFLAGSAASFPVWLKLDRRGDQVTGSISQDGETWQIVGMTTLGGSLNPYAALAVTSHDTSVLNTATFDHVIVASQVAFASADVGDVGIAGDNNGDQHQMVGGGGDIWNTTDAFNYHYQAIQDDGQMIVEIDSLQNTHPFAKGGVMIRASLDPSAANLLIDVTPSGLVELLSRTDAGAETQWIGGLSNSTFPIWLRLTRSGSTISASASHDGSTWIEVGSTSSIHLQSDALIGIAVTSHERGVVTAAMIDDLSLR
jgi:regulation of enolase protein 1 (concanavalin A-like superfamily)